MRFITGIFLFIFPVSFQCIAQDTTQHIIADRFNKTSQQQKPYVILISADGFRYDFAKKYNAVNLLSLSKQGVAADYMQPCYPSLTYPNHYAIITGLYPSHNGLVDNDFYDAKRGLYDMNNKEQVVDGTWYGGTPLWVLAEQQQLLSASYFWVASESNIQNIYPTYYYHYNEKRTIDERIQTVVNWLQLPAEKRPHFISFYFPEVDHEAHHHGPDSKETAAAVHYADQSIGKLVAAINTLNLPVNFIFVSDHGMISVDNKNTIPLPATIDTSKFIVPESNALLQLYAKDKNDIKPVYSALKKQAKDFDVYLASQVPARLHYSKKDDRYNRIGDIILMPHLPKIFNITSKTVTPGKHGFDPAIKEMHASFYAWGPAFKNNYKIRGFENIHVYPLIAEILGLTYNPSTIDGKLEVLKPVLK